MSDISRLCRRSLPGPPRHILLPHRPLHGPTSAPGGGSGAFPPGGSALPGNGSGGGGPPSGPPGGPPDGDGPGGGWVAAMAASILQRLGPVGRPPGLTPSNASDAREFSRPIFVDFVCRASSHAAMIAVAIRFASVLSASAANRQPIRPR